MKHAAESQARLESLHREVELARMIQKSLLPDRLPKSSQISVAAIYRSAALVGGDYYDVMADENGLGAIVADVAGHGIPAALIVSELKICYRYERPLLNQPERLLSAVNRALLGNVAGGFVTACAVYLDLAGGRILCANAGHPALLVHRRSSGEIISLRPLGRVLGFFEECGIERAELNLEKGDRLLLFTDGLLEGYGADGMFGEERVRELLMANSDLGAEGLAATLLENMQ